MIGHLEATAAKNRGGSTRPNPLLLHHTLNTRRAVLLRHNAQKETVIIIIRLLQEVRDQVVLVRCDTYHTIIIILNIPTIIHTGRSTTLQILIDVELNATNRDSSYPKYANFSIDATMFFKAPRFFSLIYMHHMLL